MKNKNILDSMSSEEAILDIGFSEETDALGFLPEGLEEDPEANESLNPRAMETRQSSAEYRREVIYMLAAQGMKFGEIAVQIGISGSAVTAALNQPDAHSKILFHQERLFGKSVRKRMDSLAHKAVDNLEEMLETEDEKTKAKATLYVLDQAVGKAKQTIQHEGSMIGDLIDRVNNAREVQELSEAYKQPKDKLESFIDNFVPDHTVGVRKREKK